jgi:hypothetical protein
MSLCLQGHAEQKSQAIWTKVYTVYRQISFFETGLLMQNVHVWGSKSVTMQL